MPLYLNNVSVGGYMTKDPIDTPTKDGLPRTKFTVALNHPAKNGKTDYMLCVAWGDRAIQIAQYARRGQAIIVVGELSTSQWTDSNGGKHKTTEIVVDKFNLVGNKPTTPQRPNEATVSRPAPPM